MWQADTFDPARIDKELGWAERYRHEHDARLSARSAVAARCRRLQESHRSFLTIAAKHEIRPMFVLFDSCWDPFPKRASTGAETGRAQLGLGSGPWREGAG